MGAALRLQVRQQEVVVILVKGEGGLTPGVAGGMGEGDRHDGC